MDATPLRAWSYLTLAELFDGTVPGPAPDDPPEGPIPVARAAAALAAALAGSGPPDPEFTRLFVNAPGGVPAPPYASWYLDGALLGASSAWVADAYRAQGLDATGAGEPPDYLSAELEFVYFLVRHELAARSTGDAEALADVLAVEREFIHDHMARWVPTFVTRLRRATPGPLYAAAADLLLALVADDDQRLAVRCNPAASGLVG
ncbi:MAG: molecular chaperone [Vicinamibacterales bacterium]